jgi:hypothetical protein
MHDLELNETPAHVACCSRISEFVKSCVEKLGIVTNRVANKNLYEKVVEWRIRETHNMPRG